MKTPIIIAIVLSSSILSAVLTSKFTTSAPVNIKKETFGNNNVEAQLSAFEKRILTSINKNLQLIEARLKTKASQPEDTPNNPEIIEHQLSKMNPQDIEETLNIIHNNQEVLLTQLKSSDALPSTSIKKLITNQRKFIETIKDIRWEQTPMHQLDLGDITELEEEVFNSDKKTFLNLLQGFPLEVSLATCNLEKTAKDWNYRTKENWDLLMQPGQGGGVFYLHVTLDDLIKTKNSYKVTKFLKEISSKTQIVVYHPKWEDFINSFKKSTNSNLFEKHKKMLRLNIGNDHKALTLCTNSQKVLAFLRNQRYRR